MAAAPVAAPAPAAAGSSSLSTSLAVGAAVAVALLTAAAGSGAAQPVSQFVDAPVPSRHVLRLGAVSSAAALRPSPLVASASRAAAAAAATATAAPSHSGPGRPPTASPSLSAPPPPSPSASRPPASPSSTPPAGLRKCGLDPHPWLDGSFDNATAPYWTPSPAQGCTIRAFDDDAAGRCFGNRTIFVMGNSVARGLFYELPAMMPPAPDDGVDPSEMVLVGLEWVARGQAPPRMWQKEACKKIQGDAGELWNGASCTTTIEPINAHGRFQWRQWFWDPPPDLEVNELVADICSGTDPADCMAAFFAGATERDYLAFNMGLMLASQRLRLQALGLWYDKPKREGGTWPWLAASVANFTGALARLVPIPRAHMAFVNAHRIIRDDAVNEFTPHVNDFLVPLLLAAGIPCIDQRTINAGREEYYSDQVRARLCMGGGGGGQLAHLRTSAVRHAAAGGR